MSKLQNMSAKCRYVLSRHVLMTMFCLYGTLQLNAQTVGLTSSQKADSSLIQAIKLYDRTIGRNSFLYTGKTYVDQYDGIEGHQFFGEDYWELGEIIYEGQHFDSVYLLYDIHKDQVLLEHFNSSGSLAPIRLYDSKISSFKLQGHTFIKLQKDTLSGLSAGFYDELFQGENVSVYVQRRKQIYKTNSSQTVTEVFEEKHRFYLKKDNLFYQIRSKGNISKVLVDRKKEIKRYIRSNNLYYRQNQEQMLILVARYYESLKS